MQNPVNKAFKDLFEGIFNLSQPESDWNESKLGQANLSLNDKDTILNTLINCTIYPVMSGTIIK